MPCLVCGKDSVWVSPTGHAFCDGCRAIYKERFPTVFGRLYNRSDLADLKPPDTTFGPYIVSGGVNMVYGKWGAAKSLLVLSWAASLTTGLAWHGYTVDPTNVIYWAAEGRNGLHARLTAWEQHHNATIPDDRLYVPEKSPTLDSPATYGALAKVVEETGATHLMIDTLIRVKGALRENEADELGGYLLTELAHKICDQTGCSITLVHHIGHEAKDRPRGSSSITDNLDGLYEIRDVGGSARALFVRKLKDQPYEDVPDNFRLVPVGDSVILEPTNTVLLTDQQTEILDALQGLSPNGEWITSTVISGRAGVHRNRVREALGRLVGVVVDYRLGRGQASEYRLLPRGRSTQQEVPGFESVHPPDELPDPF